MDLLERIKELQAELLTEILKTVLESEHKLDRKVDEILANVPPRHFVRFDPQLTISDNEEEPKLRIFSIEGRKPYEGKTKLTLHMKNQNDEKVVQNLMEITDFHFLYFILTKTKESIPKPSFKI